MRHDDRQQQRTFGYCETRLQRDDGRDCEEASGDDGAPFTKEGNEQPPHREHGQHAGDQRRQAIGGDGLPRLVAEQFTGAILQPVDADGAEGETLALEGGVDQVVPLDHVARGLRVDDLGAINRRQQKRSREIGQKRQRQEGQCRETRASRQTVKQRGAIALQALQRRWDKAHADVLATPEDRGIIAQRGPRGLDTDSAVKRLRKPVEQAEGGECQRAARLTRRRRG